MEKQEPFATGSLRVNPALSFGWMPSNIIVIERFWTGSIQNHQRDSDRQRHLEPNLDECAVWRRRCGAMQPERETALNHAQKKSRTAAARSGFNGVSE